MEDDAILDDSNAFFFEDGCKVVESLMRIIPSNFHILQIGYLPNNRIKGVKGLIANLLRLVTGRNRYDLKSRIRLMREMPHSETRALDRKVGVLLDQKIQLLDGLRLGTHAYVIDRTAARRLTEIFEQREGDVDFVTIDQYLMSKSISGNDIDLHGVRLSRSIINQDQSDSDNLDKTLF
jgi:GR25 family glycosyltransferase involved in LPS biosynthesis